MESELEKYYLWPNGDYCEACEFEQYSACMSDDYRILFSSPDDIEREAHLEVHH